MYRPTQLSRRSIASMSIWVRSALRGTTLVEHPTQPASLPMKDGERGRNRTFNLLIRVRAALS
jgi:hypothetical protein